MNAVRSLHFLSLAVLLTVIPAGCKKPSPSSAVTGDGAATPRAAASAPQPSRVEERTGCISMERTLALVGRVRTSEGKTDGVDDEEATDRAMRAIGYRRAALEMMNMSGPVIHYTRGCEVDEEGSMVRVQGKAASLVTILTQGQPDTSPLVSISTNDVELYHELVNQLYDLGFEGEEPLFTREPYRVATEEFISGTGYAFRIYRQGQADGRQ